MGEPATGCLEGYHTSREVGRGAAFLTSSWFFTVMICTHATLRAVPFSHLQQINCYG